MADLTNPQHETFAQHVAAGLSLTQAAIRAGYKGSAANNMGSRIARLGPVAQRIEELKALRGQAVVSSAGIRSPHSRVTAIEDRWDRMRRIILERSADPEMQSVPGGKTGLLCMTFKQVGSGKDAYVVREYKVDTGLLSELREHEKLAAEELGQWTTRHQSYSESVSITRLDGSALRTLLAKSSGQLPEAERAQILEAEPAVAELLASTEVDRMAVIGSCDDKPKETNEQQ